VRETTKRHALRIEISTLGNIGEASGSSDHLVGHYCIDLPALNVGEKHVQGGTVIVAPGNPASS